MLAERFLKLLESKKLVEASVIADLRGQIRGLGEEVSPEAVSELLIDNGYLSAAQGKKLLRELHAGTAPDAGMSQEEIVMLEAADLGPSRGFTALPDEDDDEDEPVELEAVEPVKPRRQPDSVPDLFSDAGAGFPGTSRPAAARAQYQKWTLATNPWDTKLILGGSALLLFLLIALVFLYVSLTRGTAAEVFQAAEEDYRAQAYTQAIAKYDRFLKKYPEDPNASLARVRRGTARMRSVAGGDPASALKVAHEVLPEIENESAFAEARPELASMLPAIAENFVARAKQAVLKGEMQDAEQLVELAERAMDLVDNPSYIPTTLRRSQEMRLDRITEDRALVERDINREKQLALAVKDIDQKLAADDPAAAYQRMDQLLSAYPGLENSEALVSAVQRIADKQRDLVQVRTQPIEPLTEPVEPPSQAQLALANRSGTEAGRPVEETAFVLAAGSVHALEVNSGELLWHYFVGNQTTVNPQRLGPAPGADAVLADFQRQEIVRVQARDGSTLWRLPIGEGFARPLVEDQTLLVSTESGRLLVVEADSGRSPRQAVLPQPLPVGPAVDDERATIFQVAEHSNLYVLDRNSLECREVFYLGHDRESVQLAPVIAMGHVLIAENAGADYAVLHVIATDDEGTEVRRAQEPLRLNGRVLVPPLVFESHVAVVTDLGAVHVFDVDPSANQPVRQVAQQLPTGGPPMIRYPATQGVDLWIGDYRLTKYQIQFSRGQLVRQWIRSDGDIYVAPIHLFGDVLVQVRRSKDTSGVTVSAVRSDTAEPIWQTEVAVPTARIIPAPDNSYVHAISETGTLFKLTADQLEQGGVLSWPVEERPDASLVGFRNSVNWDDGRIGFFSGTDQSRVVLYDAAGSRELYSVPLQLPEGGIVAAPPVPFADGLLVPLDSGQVHWVDVQTGQLKTLPFQPALAGGADVDWQSPAPISDTEFVIGDRQGTIYRVGVQAEPKPHLALFVQRQSPGTLVGPLANSGDMVYGVFLGDNGYQLHSLRLPELETAATWPLTSQPSFGPAAYEDLVLLAMPRDGLLALNGQGKRRWQAPLPYGSISGHPVRHGDSLWLSSVRGDVWEISAETGEELNRVQFGKPLRGSPARLGNQLVVAAADGTIHVEASPLPSD